MYLEYFGMEDELKKLFSLWSILFGLQNWKTNAWVCIYNGLPNELALGGLC